EPVLARARACPGRAFDVVQREWVDPWACGLVDPLPVALAALDTSVSAAMTALTAEVLVHRSEPPTSTEPCRTASAGCCKRQTRSGFDKLTMSGTARPEPVEVSFRQPATDE